MTVRDLCNLYIEPMETVTIFDNDSGKNVFEGSFSEAIRSEYAEAEIGSFGIEDAMICININ